MFKAIWHEKQILIVLLWSVLIFVGYNVLTAEVEAAEKDDKKVCEDYNGKWLKYGGGDDDKRCVIENEKDRQLYSIRPGFSKDGTSSDAEYGIEDLVSYDNEGNKVYPNTNTDSDSPKEICKNHDGKWKDGSCTFPNDNDRQDAEVGFDHTMEEKGLWDNYAADKNIKKACDKAGLKMDKKSGYCDTNNEKGEDDADKFYREYDKPEKEEQIEDWRNEVEPIEGEKIPVTTLKFDDEEEREKYQEEMAKYEVEAVEPTDDGTPDPDPDESEQSSDESEEQEDDDGGEKESEESDDSEDSESESEE